VVAPGLSHDGHAFVAREMMVAKVQPLLTIEVLGLLEEM
jgi:hypothetical protein